MRQRDRAFFALPALLLVLLGLAGCATTTLTRTPTRTPDPRDPFESVNRSTFAFNQTLDKAVIRPTLRGYRKVTPRVVRIGIGNFFENAGYPIVLVNNLLQGKFASAANDTGRFLLNSTLGIGGLLDPASDAGLDRNNEDFGQTIGRYGMPAGPYIVMPFLGPYTLRDGLGGLVDDFLEPRHYLEDDSTRWLLWAVGQLDRRAGLTEAEAILDRSGDPYAFVRSAYLQRRQYLVTDGAESAEPPIDEDPELMEDLEGDTPTAPQ